MSGEPAGQWGGESEQSQPRPLITGVTGTGSYQVGKTRSLDLASIRAAAAIRHQVHPKLSLSQEERSHLRDQDNTLLCQPRPRAPLHPVSVHGRSSARPSPVAWPTASPSALTLGASMAVYVAPGGTW